MAVQVTYPGVYIEEVPSGVRSIAGVSTSTALFIGWAARGRTDRATRITSFADYEREFGGIDGRTLLGYSLKHFFDNGGADAYVIRLIDTATAVAAKATLGADLEIEASSPGVWASGYKVAMTPMTGDATLFRLDVLEKASGDAVVESFDRLSLSASDPRFVGRVVNEASRYVKASLTSTTPGTPSAATVDLGDGSVASPPGNDGTVLNPTDFDFHDQLDGLFDTGKPAAEIDIFNLLCVPGLLESAAIASLQKRSRDRRAFMIVDCDEKTTITNAPSTAAAIAGADAINSALYFPWVKAADPAGRGALRPFPPCGFVAGIYARTDASRGVWKAPAGSEASLTGANSFVAFMGDTENGQLNPKAVNCLRTLPVYGNVVWGARTLHGDNDRGSEWKYVPVRRMALFIEESLYRGTQWVVFEPNDEPLWSQIRLNVGAFMNGLFRQGAFQGRTPREAYFVRCDRTTTTQADINLGIVNILVGFAPLKPAEFVVIKLQQIAGEIAT